MILVIDNYDSFTYNLVQRLGEIDAQIDVRVVRNDKLSIADIRAMQPERILISPGPCTPSEAGISVPIIEHLAVKYRYWAFAWGINRLVRHLVARSSARRN